MYVDAVVYDKYFGGLFSYNNSNWNVARGQLNTRAIYTDGIFYGMNGLETGTFFNLSNLSVDTIIKKLDYVGGLNNITLDPSLTAFRIQSNSPNIRYIPPIRLTTNITNLSLAFNNLRSLECVNSSLWDTRSVVNMRYMFNSCFKLGSVQNFNTSNVKNMSFMFNCCNCITTTPNFNTVNVTNMARYVSILH